MSNVVLHSIDWIGRAATWLIQKQRLHTWYGWLFNVVATVPEKTLPYSAASASVNKPIKRVARKQCWPIKTGEHREKRTICNIGAVFRSTTIKDGEIAYANARAASIFTWTQHFVTLRSDVRADKSDILLQHSRPSIRPQFSQHPVSAARHGSNRFCNHPTFNRLLSTHMRRKKQLPNPLKRAAKRLARL